MTDTVTALKTVTETVGERELRLTRLIDAPREAVWNAWTDPELLKRWFAPLPYTTPEATFDLVGGSALGGRLVDIGLQVVDAGEEVVGLVGFEFVCQHERRAS